jgi:hypothetical protein
MNTIDITPTPRVLRMLGEVDFKAWQCLCEIIDNSIDSFKVGYGSNNANNNKSIKVKLPAASVTQLDSSHFLEIEDNGSGMTIEQLQLSLKAGFSGNDPIEKMGLFGMGFNISTARLGGRTEVITTTSDNPNYLRIVIDFNELEREGKFNVPVEIIPKKADELNSHGTKVRITKLRIDHIRPLFQKKSITTKLGKIYGRILRNSQITLMYGAAPCKPFEHCVWSKYRSGENRHGRVPAVIEVDELIDSKNYCVTCWVWLSSADSRCPSCGSSNNLSLRERRVKGWLGIQRYFSQDHFGIDLIRNGRVIKELDKSFFSWLDPSTQEAELEYPIDGHERKGRIVGELEIDFVRVTHTKDAFEDTSQDWKEVVKVIRGDSPIRPQIAKSRGYPENESPLAQLFSAFRTAKAGVKNLVPTRSNGGAMITDATIDDLLLRFNNGETDYQSDEKWWDLLNSAPSSPFPPGDLPGSGPGGPSPFDPPPPGIPPGINPPPVTPPSRGGTEAGPLPPETPPIEFETDLALSKSYSLDVFRNISIHVIAEYAMSGSNDRGYQVSVRGSELTFKYWRNARIFTNSLLTPADFLINELAYHLHTIAQTEISQYPLTEIELLLREKYFPDLQPNLDEINRQVRAVCEEMAAQVRDGISKLTSFDSSVIPSADLKVIRKHFATNHYLKPEQIDIAITKGEFVSYAPFTTIAAILKRYPWLVFDGNFFNVFWEETDGESIINQVLAEDLQQILGDIRWFEEQQFGFRGALWRAKTKRLVGSLEIFYAWKAK